LPIKTINFSLKLSYGKSKFKVFKKVVEKYYIKLGELFMQTLIVKRGNFNFFLQNTLSFGILGILKVPHFNGTMGTGEKPLFLRMV